MPVRLKAKKKRYFSFALPGLQKRSASSAKESTTPPRSAPTSRRLAENALVNLMHAERPTALTTRFIERGRIGNTGKSVRLAPMAVHVRDKRDMVETSTSSSLRASPQLKQEKQHRNAAARVAGQHLANLVESNPGKFDASLAQGIIPDEMLHGLNIGHLIKLDVNEYDVIHEFQEIQYSQNRRLLHEIATDLTKLGVASVQDVERILPQIVAGTYLPTADTHQDDEIVEYETPPEERIRSAFGKLPERLRDNEIIEAFENLGKLDPVILLHNKAEAYFDKIDDRLAQINAPGTQ
ncbi:hypothetical protein [Burkholderia sp. MSMB1826]|uniref:hypothetical protein n=1 Tax=Burkholderia sp. MSMB1826 TaxID=1637875 RepID=UPI000A4AF435|nr:hypothetical protein [Burkholderia sp. MSMB1826]